MSEQAQQELKERVLAEKAKGNVVLQAFPGEFMSAALADIVEQPADGLLYDLNRLEEVALTFIDQPKWVNDFAVALVIRKLMEQRNALRRQLAMTPDDGYVPPSSSSND